MQGDFDMNRRAQVIERETRETRIRCEVDLDGAGRAQVATGIAFFDHMLTALALHGRIDLILRCEGDLLVDDHHSVEDCGLALGQAIDGALGDRAGIRRFGFAYAPMDEALGRAVIDLSGRPFSLISLDLRREKLGALSCENIPHFFRSLATTLRAAVHLDVLRGENDHHKAEASFKALALALREAVARDDRSPERIVPSTKGAL
jgi:imidazoleglycerol phosphate dehydratase HisB